MVNFSENIAEKMESKESRNAVLKINERVRKTEINTANLQLFYNTANEKINNEEAVRDGNNNCKRSNKIRERKRKRHTERQRESEDRQERT